MVSTYLITSTAYSCRAEDKGLLKALLPEQ